MSEKIRYIIFRAVAESVEGEQEDSLMDEYTKRNLELWNKLTLIHAQSDFYDVEGFKKGRCTLKSIELEELGDISGKSLPILDVLLPSLLFTVVTLLPCHHYFPGR